MVKILNLDELELDSGRAIVVNKKEHAMKMFSTGDLIRTLKEAEKAEKGEVQNMNAMLSQMINLVDRAFPTLPRKEVEDLSVNRLTAIFEFIQATEDGDVEDAKVNGGK